MKRVIFLHGVGGTGASMQPLANALVLTVPAQCPDGPEPFDMGQDRQWFSVRGVTEENRPARIAAALPAFVRILEAFGDPRDSLLIGFSQGAIMACTPSRLACRSQASSPYPGGWPGSSRPVTPGRPSLCSMAAQTRSCPKKLLTKPNAG